MQLSAKCTVRECTLKNEVVPDCDKNGTTCEVIINSQPLLSSKAVLLSQGYSRIHCILNKDGCNCGTHAPITVDFMLPVGFSSLHKFFSSCEPWVSCPGVGYIGSCIVKTLHIAQIKRNCINNSPNTLLMASREGHLWFSCISHLSCSLPCLKTTLKMFISPLLWHRMEHCSLKGGLLWGYLCARECKHSLRDILYTVSVWKDDEWVTFCITIIQNLIWTVQRWSECWHYKFLSVTFTSVLVWSWMTLFLF